MSKSTRSMYISDHLWERIQTSASVQQRPMSRLLEEVILAGLVALDYDLDDPLPEPREDDPDAMDVTNDG